MIPAGPTGSGRNRRLHLVYGDAYRIVRTADLDELIENLEKDLSLFVGENARTRVFVHSGVVGINGRAVLFPGRSFSGKSRLVAELVRSGAVYYSDEFAVLDDRGRVYPYARPLGLRAGSEYRGRRVDPSELGGRVGRQPLTVGTVIFTRYAKGADWRPVTISEGKAMLELLSNALGARSQAHRVMPVLAKVVDSAGCIVSERGEAAEVAKSLLG